MPNAAEIVRDHRQHYLDRKLARSPLLHFGPGAHRADVCELFQGIQANLPVAGQQLSGISTPEGLLSALLESRFDATIHGVKATILKKMERIQKAADDSLHSTGQHTLYLGYPCVVLPGESGKTKLAPLFLFAVRITVSNQKLTIRRIVEGVSNEDGTRQPSDAVFNRLFAAFVEREYGVELKAQNHRIDLSGSDIESKVREIFSTWTGFSQSFKYRRISPVPNRASLELLDRASTDPFIAESAILGLAEFSGQAMLDDLDEIEKALESGVACTDALSSLINPARDNSNREAIEPGSETRKWLVEKSDPSQELVIWAQKANPLVVLQGPPGTGKSQTIVNIVADALAQKKSVMVVCQKRAAIEVVHKRLSTAGLGELAVLIDDIDKDRLKVIRRLDEIEYEFEDALLSQRRRETVANSLRNEEDRIDRAITSLNHDSNKARYRYGDLQAALKGLAFLDTSHEWSPRLQRSVQEYLAKDMDKNDLLALVKETVALDSDVSRLRYGQNLWSKTPLHLATDLQTVMDLHQHSRTAHKLGQLLLQDHDSLPHDSSTQWIAAHPWSRDEESLPVAGLLSKKYDRQSLSTFHRWLHALEAIAAANPVVDSLSLSKALCDGNLDLDFFKNLESDAQSLRDLLALRLRITKQPLWEKADELLGDARGTWARHLHALALHYWRSELLSEQRDGMIDVPNISNLIHHLANVLEEKRRLDTIDILSKYQNRVSTRNDLKNRNLLRLRGRAGLPKTSLRKLYTQGLESLAEVAPLLLVSPETAASMLPLKPGLFDIVVIDEASQMFVAEAIPMLFRAKRAVIAGDQQQMPPADFFAYSDSEDEEPDIEESEENTVLIAADGVYRLLEAADDALAAGSHSRLSLQVHYRSARRELIDFSNHAFYEGKLIVPSGNAPLPTFMQTAIEFEDVGGLFLKGVNEIEARRIVELLRHIWKEPEESRPTLGVIVANTRQRDYVLELLQLACDHDTQFRRMLELESDRIKDGEDVSFFVRSVEHVQGDERDVIIFALTYAASSRNFGPLNTKGDGRKRLNVAVTRAKRGMIILNSLNVGHISNPAEKGVQERYFVWQYLRYARAVASSDLPTIDLVLNQLNEHRQATRVISSTTESPFEQDVKEFIESLGFHVDCQVGESGFRIDLGVRSNKNNSTYLCGIECDGARYHSGWRARTSDVWRQEILESKGWKIFRIWSTNWFDNPEAAKTDLKRNLREIEKLDSADEAQLRYQFIQRAGAQSQIDVSIAVEDSEQPNDLSVAGLRDQNMPSSPEQVVQIGDTVKFEYVNDGRTASARIVSSQSDPTSGTINVNAPLAKALLDRVEGEEISFLSPNGEVQITILSIVRNG